MEIHEDCIIISNIEKYDITFHNGSMIIKRKQKDYSEFLKNNFTSSKLLNVKINDSEIKINKYSVLLKYIYNFIDDIEIIKHNTRINIIDGECNNKGFQYLQKLNISFQGIDANKCMDEIINMCKCVNIVISLKIKLNNEEIIEI
jgi:hypothetical protein